MPRFVVLLRGVNVGKAKRVPMAEFRALLEGLGFTEVETLLNSGNAVFTGPGRSARAHAASIASSLAGRFGFEVPVVVKSSAEFAAAVAECPFAAGVKDPSRLLVVFTQEREALSGLSSLASLVRPPERFAVGSHAAHLDCAGGILESRLANALLARSGSAVTSRNWATVLKIAGLGSPMAPAVAPAGYSGTPLARKLGIAPAARVLRINAPADYEALLAPIPDGVAFTDKADRSADLVHVFVTERKALVRHIRALRGKLRPDVPVWVSWPKKSSRVPTTVTEDTIREAALPLGFVDVKVCAVSEVWSGLKLVIRKEIR